MQAILTVVMYHYVRDLHHARYPDLKSLCKDGFLAQIQYIKKHYNVISGAELMDAVVEGAPLPPHPLMLTFDDGYVDHFNNVLPVLERNDLPACFFPAAKCTVDREVLGVNKIHFVLASTRDKRKFVDYICKKIDENRFRYNLQTSTAYWEKLAKPGRFDPADVVFCKRILQRDLPRELRQALTNELFNRFVTADEASFSRELYMTFEQIRGLQASGMYVGSHGFDHYWLDTLSSQHQEREVDQSLSFLKSVGADIGRWIMCYPHGAYDKSLLAVLKSRNCIVGLTAETGLASLRDDDPLTLPRIDTNDLPKDATCTMNGWTLKAMRDNEQAAMRVHSTG